MLSRFIAKSSNLRFITLISSHSPPHNLKRPIPIPILCFSDKIPRFYSTNNGGGGNRDDDGNHFWNITSEADDAADSLFGEEKPPTEAALKDGAGDPVSPASRPREAAQKWDFNDGGVDDDVFGDDPAAPAAAVSPVSPAPKWDMNDGGVDDVFGDPVATPVIPQEKWDSESFNGSGSGDDVFGDVTRKERPVEQWNFGEEDNGEVDLFSGVEVPRQEFLEEDLVAKAEEEEKRKQLEIEEKMLTEIVKGPQRAFGDLIAASGITDEMLDTLLALKDLSGIQGLRPLHELEEERYLKNTTKSTKAEIERLKQEEVAKARVQKIDDKGRAYGTGRRKCSIARVWVQPGEGKFVVNDKEFDVYFPMLDHRAILLRPFSETKTLGKWNVDCTVKGGGVSGQVGAIRLGISRALQNWAPDLRPPLRAAGFLTRDSRVVERKKPGKAKARKSFQWVKR